MSVGLIAQLITSHITKSVHRVLFYLLAHPGCHAGTGVSQNSSQALHFEGDF